MRIRDEYLCKVARSGNCWIRPAILFTAHLTSLSRITATSHRTMRNRLTLLLAATTAVLVACGDRSFSSREVSESVVIGSAGGSVKGPDGVTVVIPPGAIAEGQQYAFSVGVVSPSADGMGLNLSALCGRGYLISPTNVRLAKPARVTLPEPNTCLNPAFFVSSPQSASWATAPSMVENGYRTAELEALGVVGVGEVVLTLAHDTTVYVGSILQGQIRDRAGMPLTNTWLWTRTLDPDVIAPDNKTGGGRQRALAVGMARLEVSVPTAGLSREIKVNVMANPARRLHVIRGKDQKAEAGRMLPESFLALVTDEQGRPVPEVWVDFLYRHSEGVSIIGGGPTDAEGRVEATWRLPNEPGRYTIEVVVPGTNLRERVTVQAVRPSE